MAIWGMGAFYEEDVSAQFIENGVAFVGWDKKEAPVLHNMLDHIRVGDIIYLKSFTPKNKKLTIKAIGIVTNAQREVQDLRLKDRLYPIGKGVTVAWKTPADFRESIEVTERMFKNNVFNNTLYQEYNDEVIDLIFKQLLKVQR